MLPCIYCGVMRPKWEIAEGYPVGSCLYLCQYCLERVELVGLLTLLLRRTKIMEVNALKILTGHPPPFWAVESSLIPAARKWAGRPYELRTRKKMLTLTGLTGQEVYGQLLQDAWAFNCLMTSPPESWMPIRVRKEGGRMHLIDGLHRVALALALERQTLRAVRV